MMTAFSGLAMSDRRSTPNPRVSFPWQTIPGKRILILRPICLRRPPVLPLIVAVLPFNADALHPALRILLTRWCPPRSLFSDRGTAAPVPHRRSRHLRPCLSPYPSPCFSGHCWKTSAPRPRDSRPAARQSAARAAPGGAAGARTGGWRCAVRGRRRSGRDTVPGPAGPSAPAIRGYARCPATRPARAAERRRRGRRIGP